MTMLPKLSETTQTISFSEGDGVCSSEVYATDVVVTTNAGNHNHGSSKVKLRNLVDYNWEPKFYPGQLLAVHISGKYMAYSIKAANPLNPGSWSGMVRVVYNPEPGTERRTLIKGMKGVIQDLAFAHIQNQVVLACIDEQGNFYVYEIEVTDVIRYTLIAEIVEDTGAGGGGGGCARVVWCPYIPDEDDAPDDDVARLLLTTHDNQARMWNMRVVCGALSGCARAGAGALLGGAGGAGAVLAASDHSAPIVDAAFSPDGTALATASADGFVMFFQVYMHNESSPRCLHKWQPHGGKPLSCLFFLDNHKNYNSDVQFWKFAVTGAENNTVIKIWSCKSWNCLQTITFAPCLGPETPVLGLKAMLDTSASYLVLSDFKTRSLYVLNMAWDVDDTTAYCRSISEFLLPYPVLSFVIIDADEEEVKCESSCDDPFHRNGSSGDARDSPDDFDLHHNESGGGAGARRVRLRLYIVQPKGLQEGELVYCPPPPTADGMNAELSELALESKCAEGPPAMASSILQQQSQQLKNLLMRSQTQPGSLIVQRAESPAAHPQLNLMTPDAFSSPGKREEDDPPLSATPDAPPPARLSIGTCPSEVGSVTQAVGGVAGGAGDAPHPSGGSSPSREVQEIMAHNEHEYYKDLEEEEEASGTPVKEPCPEVEVEGEGAGSPVGSAGGAGAEALAAAGEALQRAHSPHRALHHHAAHPPHPPHPPLVHANSDTSWPQISLAQISEANQRKASSDKSSSQSLNNSVVADAGVAPPPPGLSPADRARLEMLEHKLDKLTELVSNECGEVRALRAAQEAVCPRALVDEALAAHAARSAAALHAALGEGGAAAARAADAAARAAAAAAGAGAARALEPLAHALQHELAAKISATDHLLRENIEKLANSKTVMERLSTSIAASLADMVRDSFRDALIDQVLPLMEKAHAQIFRQVNQAFQNGTKEFAANAEAMSRAAAERGGAAGAASLRAALERHAQALAAQPQHLTAALGDVVHSVLEKEMAWWREQARGVALQLSRAHTPSAPAHAHAHASAADRQMQVAQIQSLMSSGDCNGAFQLALSGADLALVVAACRAADPARVFAPPCRLKQHVLLSLVQQLAADMANDTHLKHRYLEEAVMNLDPANPVTREHLPTVIRELQKQIMAFLNANPGHALSRQFKMLLMATDSLVKNV